MFIARLMPSQVPFRLQVHQECVEQHTYEDNQSM